MTTSSDQNSIEEKKALFFRKKLMTWYASSHRPLPWKGEKDPYVIWLSEIILQQTRVEQGLPYFQRFVSKYPTVKELADAPQDEILKLWEGLGYYSRARNMHEAAKYIADELNGRFPRSFEEILKLKGVGPYTAAAIASFAYDLPHAVLDGNVFRVLARFLGIDLPIDSTGGKKHFKIIADQLLDKQQAGKYNQAIMDFGATQCTPQKPACDRCPLQTQCQAFSLNKVDQLPVKAKKIRRRTRFFHYFVINQENKVWIRKREQKDIWRNLYDFPLVELEALSRDPKQILGKLDTPFLPPPTTQQVTKISQPYQQLLTHQKIIAVFIEIQANKDFQPNLSSVKQVERKNLSNFAFPKLIDCYLRDKSLYLNL